MSTDAEKTVKDKLEGWEREMRRFLEGDDGDLEADHQRGDDILADLCELAINTRFSPAEKTVANWVVSHYRHIEHWGHA